MEPDAGHRPPAPAQRLSSPSGAPCTSPPQRAAAAAKPLLPCPSLFCPPRPSQRRASSPRARMRSLSLLRRRQHPPFLYPHRIHCPPALPCCILHKQTHTLHLLREPRRLCYCSYRIRARSPPLAPKPTTHRRQLLGKPTQARAATCGNRSIPQEPKCRGSPPEPTTESPTRAAGADGRLHPSKAANQQGAVSASCSVTAARTYL